MWPRDPQLPWAQDSPAVRRCEIGSYPKWVMRHCPGAGNMRKEFLLGGRPWLATVFPTVVLRSAEGAKIMSNDVSQKAIQVNRSLVVGGGALVGIGGLLGFTGMVLVGSALLSATRQWVNQLEQPPSEIARRKWQQARAAASAGTEAWRNGPQTPSSPSLVSGQRGRADPRQGAGSAPAG